MKVPSASCLAIVGPIWWVTASAADCWKPGVDDRWDVWAELKFAKDGRVWFSRAVFIRQ